MEFGVELREGEAAAAVAHALAIAARKACGNRTIWTRQVAWDTQVSKENPCA